MQRREAAREAARKAALSGGGGGMGGGGYGGRGGPGGAPYNVGGSGMGSGQYAPVPSTNAMETGANAFGSAQAPGSPTYETALLSRRRYNIISKTCISERGRRHYHQRACSWARRSQQAILRSLLICPAAHRTVHLRVCWARRDMIMHD